MTKLQAYQNFIAPSDIMISANFKPEGGATFSLTESGGVYCKWLCSDTQYALKTWNTSWDLLNLIQRHEEHLDDLNHRGIVGRITSSGRMSVDYIAVQLHRE